jgi:ribosomal protein S18 acetylase RimI-like enzyme
MATVRAARSDDLAAPALLHESAAAFYDRFAGDPGRARRLLARAYRHPGHTASFEICRVAEREGAVVGIVAGFAAEDADRLARRFLLLTVPRLPPGRWPTVARQLREARRLTPAVPAGAWYVDALAVAAPARRAGIAHQLLEDAAASARAAGARVLALDTTLENTPARALYESAGFEPGAERRASPAAAEALGASGFIAYRKRV